MLTQFRRSGSFWKVENVRALHASAFYCADIVVIFVIPEFP